MSRIVEVRPSDGYRIWLRFSDGAEGEVDLSDLAGRGVDGPNPTCSKRFVWRKVAGSSGQGRSTCAPTPCTCG